MIDSYVKQVESGDCCLNICKNGEEFQFENDDYGLLDACERQGFDEGTPSYFLIYDGEENVCVGIWEVRSTFANGNEGETCTGIRNFVLDSETPYVDPIDCCEYKAGAGNEIARYLDVCDKEQAPSHIIFD